jgi:hypothetical protein
MLVASMAIASAHSVPARSDSQSPRDAALLPIPQGKALLYLFNGSGPTLFAPKYTFKIDGKKAVKLGRHQYSTVPVDPGRHEFQVTDRKLRLELQDGQYSFVMYAYHPEKSWASPFAGKSDDLVALTEEQARELIAVYQYLLNNDATS